MNELLTPKEQLDVLKKIDWTGMEYWGRGLCTEIYVILGETISTFDYREDISAYIPLFTRKNALLFGANVAGSFWFDCDKKGYNQRREFINWIIKNLKSM